LVGWYFGFHLHLIINDQGELLAATLTPGNTDDRKPVPEMAKDPMGKLLGDRGYISQALLNPFLNPFLNPSLNQVWS